MNREEIERGFTGAGWEVAEPSWPHLLVGNGGDLSILAYRSLAETGDPVFELLDRKRNVNYWVRVIPTPRLARALLEEHGDFAKGPLVGNRFRRDAGSRSVGGDPNKAGATRRAT